VASLKDGASAERIVAKLNKDGYPAYLSRIVIPDKGLWFRVRVGSYTDRGQAAEDMGRLARDQRKPILVKK
jgi:cell division septation protein DedD